MRDRRILGARIANLGTAVLRKPFPSKLIDSFAQAIYPVKSGNSSAAVSDGLGTTTGKVKTTLSSSPELFGAAFEFSDMSPRL